MKRETHMISQDTLASDGTRLSRGCLGWLNTKCKHAFDGTNLEPAVWFDVGPDYARQRYTVRAAHVIELNTPGMPHASSSWTGVISDPPPNWTSAATPNIPFLIDQAKEDEKYPHKCPKCNGPAYIGLAHIDCKYNCGGPA